MIRQIIALDGRNHVLSRLLFTVYLDFKSKSRRAHKNAKYFFFAFGSSPSPLFPLVITSAFTLDIIRAKLLVHNNNKKNEGSLRVLIERFQESLHRKQNNISI